MNRIMQCLLTCVAMATTGASFAGGTGDAVAMGESLRVAIDDGTEIGQIFVDLGEDDGVDIGDLQLGESRSIIDHEGRSVLVTRTESGIALDIDGKTFELPDADVMFAEGIEFAGLDAVVESEVVELEHDIDIDIVHVFETSTVDMTTEDVTIISDDAIDDATKDGIRSLLAAAGHDGVVFLSGSNTFSTDARSVLEPSGAVHRRVKVISKEVSETN